MRRLFTFGLIVFGIYYVTKGSLGIIGDLSPEGTANALKGVRGSALQELILTHYKNVVLKTTELTVDAIETTVTDLNDDGRDDVIAVVESGMTCGTGGCIASIFIENDEGELTPISFAYAVKSIEVLGSITKGMHDLRINGDMNSKMIWDGTTYVHEQI
jgi:hypothetical protein